MRRDLLLSMNLMLAACSGGDDKRSAILRVDVVGDWADPASPPRTALAQSTQLGLVQFDGAGQIVPGIAASWRVVDGGRSIIFRLRPAVWSDGRALKAGDVVAVFRRIMAPGSRNSLQPLLAGIDNAASVIAGRAPPNLLGVTAPLPNVVEVRLSAPDSGMLQLLALPQAAIVRAGSRPPSMGAFTVAADAAVRPLVLKPNPRYFAATSTQLGGITLTAAAEPASGIARFVRGDTDLVVGAGIAGLGAARTLAPRTTLRIEASWGFYGYRANLLTGPLSDAGVRQAVSMAIDRDALVRRTLGLAQIVPLVSLVPPDAGSTAPVVPDWTALDPAARRATVARLLAAAGYNADKPLALRVSLPPGREHAQVFEAVARDLAAVGIAATSVERGLQAERAAIARGDFDLTVVEYSAPAPKPLFFLRPFTCAASASYCNPGADALIEAARTMADEAARGDALAQAERAILADTPMIPLFVPVRWALVGRGVTGWTDNQGGQHPLAALALEEKSR